MAPASIAGDNRTFLPEQISSLRPNAYTLHRHYEAKRQILIALSGRVKPADQFGQSFIHSHPLLQLAAISPANPFTQRRLESRTPAWEKSCCKQYARPFRATLD